MARRTFLTADGAIAKKQTLKKQSEAQTASLAKADGPFLALVLILVAFGLLMLYSASYVAGIYRFNNSFHFFSSQLVFAGLGVVAMYIVSFVDYRFLRKFAWTVMVATWGLLVIVLFMEPINNAKRWIYIGTFGTFQPSEVAKFAVILLFAHLIALNYKSMESKNLQTSFTFGVMPFVIVLLPIIILLLLEPHLSATVIICLIAVVMMFVGGTALKWFVAGGILAFACLSAALIFLKELAPYTIERFQTWVKSLSDMRLAGHQTVQSLLAIGSGGWRGLGLGNSRQKHLYVPEPQNDFIFSIICEELGFIGAVIVIVLFIALLVRGISIAMNARDRFGTMMVTGIMAQVILQATLNIAVVTNTIPNTGISLPFFSYGGTSLLMLLGEMGVVLSVSRRSLQFDEETEEAQE